MLVAPPAVPFPEPSGGGTSLASLINLLEKECLNPHLHPEGQGFRQFVNTQFPLSKFKRVRILRNLTNREGILSFALSSTYELGSVPLTL